MDREQDQMQFLGLFGIFKGSYKIIISWRKIFIPITLTLILPLTLIYLTHLVITNSLLQDTKHTEFEMHFTPRGTKRYNNLSDTLLSETFTFLLFKSAYTAILLIFFLLSTAAVIYTIASVYTGHELTFKEVMSVIPKVWKKVMVTYFCMFVVLLVFNLLAIPAMFACELYIPYPLGVILVFAVMIIYVIGMMYMSVSWQLASVVVVLGSSYEFKALTKSKDLIKGNQVVAILVYTFLHLSLFLMKVIFEMLVVHRSSLGIWMRVGFGSLCSILLSFIYLFGLVIQTVLYLFCKVYHKENIGKDNLLNHLQSYLGEYEPLSGEDIDQLEQ